MKKRFLALLLILSMVLGCLTGCEDTPDEPTKATAAAPQTQTETSAYRWYDDAGVRHAALSLGDMPYEMYDIQDFYDLVDELEALAQKPGNEGAITECYQKLLDESCRISTDYALAYIRYMENLTSDYAEDMTTLEDISTETSDALSQTLARLLDGDYADLIRKLLGGDDLAEELEDYTETDEALLSLSKEASRKVQQYNALTLAQISVTLDGETYTMDSLDEIEEEALYWEVATALGKKENEQLAPILIDLIGLYNQTAELSGYDSYAELAYEGYSRDYTPEDARALHGAVKESIVPVYQEIGELVQNYENPDVLGEIDAKKLMATVGQYIGTVDADLDLSFRHMSQVGLYSIDYYTGRGDGFTINLPQYNDAAIFMDLVGDDSDLETLVHEFGHYNAGMHQKQQALDTGFCMDTSEIHSQGLEVLFLSCADAVYGDENAAVKKLNILYNLLDSIIQGCLQDEFQQLSYAAAKDHKLTVKELNELAYRLYNEYGLETQPGVREIYSWVEIPHTYESPFYYISYATSAVNALDILSISQEDYREAADTYMRLTALPMDIPYQQALEQVGLHNTFDADTLQFIGQGVAEYVNDLSGFIDYPDAA